MMKTILSCHKMMPVFMIFIAVTALMTALISQYEYGLQPCVLCIFQRYPYGIIIVLGLLGVLLSCKYIKGVSAIMGLIGLTFLANSLIAFYHSGVELKWWPSFLEGCAVPKMEGNMEDILASIQSRTDAVRCDEIPWADPILNLSMANWNVVICFGFAIIAFVSARLIYKK